MPIRTRLLISLFLIAIIPLALFGLVAYVVSTNNLNALERDALNSSLDSANRVLLDIQQNQIRVTRDYAYWDELHDQVAKGAIDDDWRAANLASTLETSPIHTFSLNALGIWDQQNKSLFTFGPAQTLFDGLGSGLAQRLIGEPMAIFVPLDRQLYLVTAASVRTGSATDPNGIMIFGRKLSDQDTQAISAMTGNSAALVQGKDVLAGEQKQLPTPDTDQLSNVAKDGLRRFVQDRADYALAYGPIKSASGQQVAVLVMWRPRTVLQTSQDVIRMTLALAFVVGVALAFLVALLLGRSIVRPLVAISRRADQISAGALWERIDSQAMPKDELRHLADAFNRMTDRLAGSIEDRNAKIVELDQKNDALQKATAKAEELARTRGEFLSTMSHELRTPLNAIIGFSDVLMMGMSGPLNDGQQRQVERLKDNGKRLLSLINDVLDMSRIDAGRVELASERFFPIRMLNRIAAQMQVLADQKGIRFEMDFSPELPSIILGDEKRLEQIIVNLLSNAFKFTEQGTVKFIVGALADQKMWTIQVQDTGIGIPPHALDLIFEPFRQVDGSSKRAYKGSGLGLAIAQQLVQMMGGKIRVESELNVGSTFTITLPITVPEAAEVSLA